MYYKGLIMVSYLLAASSNLFVEKDIGALDLGHVRLTVLGEKIIELLLATEAFHYFMDVYRGQGRLLYVNAHSRFN